MKVGSLALAFGMALVVIGGCSRDKQGGAVAPPETSAYPELGCKHAEVQPNCTDGWCRIPAGCFVMGSPSNEWGRGRDDEEVRPITLTHSFEISEHETTQVEWTRVGFTNPSAMRDWGKDCTEANCPVGNANWYEALAYANALSAAHSPPLAPCYDLSACTGKAGTGMECPSVKLLAPSSYECAGYRLPTEAEWEYAARAGTRVILRSAAHFFAPPGGAAVGPLQGFRLVRTLD